MRSELSRRTKGCYARGLAELQREPCAFARCKKKERPKQNKISCKQARIRKKRYIEQLEKTIKDLRQRNNSLQQQNQTLKAQQHYNSTDNKVIDKPSPQHLLISQFRNLMSSMQSKNQTAIRCSLTLLRAEFGINGRERQKWIKQSLLRAVQLSMPMHFRLLLQSCEDSSKFFELLGGGPINREIIQFDESELNVLKMVKPKIKKAKQNFNKIFRKIHDAWEELHRYRGQSQRIIDEIEDGIRNPLFVGGLLLRLDGERSSNQKMKSIYPINYFKSIGEDSGMILVHENIIDQDENSEDLFYYNFGQFQ